LTRATRPGEVFRGRTVLRAHGWVATDDGVSVAYVGGDVYDRWTSGPPVVTMGLGYVVDPARWRLGYGRAAILASLGHPDTADVVRFYCGIDADNHASRRCVASIRFELLDPVPDEDDTVY
jgi:RimJ/RimL family protein N-acetyltransferase